LGNSRCLGFAGCHLSIRTAVDAAGVHGRIGNRRQSTSRTTLLAAAAVQSMVAAERTRSLPHNSCSKPGFFVVKKTDARGVYDRRGCDQPTKQSHSGMRQQPPIIVGISGASGAIYGVRLLEALHEKKIPVHLIVSKSAALTLKEETDVSIDHVRGLAQATYQNSDIGAAISSGSFRIRGMVIAPCSIRTLSDIAYGTTDSLLSRAADVTLKERRRLVLIVREAPLHAGHLRSMLAATENGAVIVPPVPAFYHRPKTIDDIINQTVGRCLDLFDIDVGLVKRWRAESDT
jgi:flavin prenyltransferase